MNVELKIIDPLVRGYYLRGRMICSSGTRRFRLPNSGNVLSTSALHKCLHGLSGKLCAVRVARFILADKICLRSCDLLLPLLLPFRTQQRRRTSPFCIRPVILTSARMTEKRFGPAGGALSKSHAYRMHLQINTLLIRADRLHIIDPGS